MRIYIAGKATGLPTGDVFIKFGAAEHWLKQIGYEVVNPTRLVSRNWSWQRCMRVCITELMKCDAICMLPDWIDSKGAQTEWALACHLGMRIINYRPKSMVVHDAGKVVDEDWKGGEYEGV